MALRSSLVIALPLHALHAALHASLLHAIEHVLKPYRGVSCVLRATELVESLLKIINREVNAKKSLDANLSGAFKRAVQLACDERRTGYQPELTNRSNPAAETRWPDHAHHAASPISVFTRSCQLTQQMIGAQADVACCSRWQVSSSRTCSTSSSARGLVGCMCSCRLASVETMQSCCGSTCCLCPHIARLHLSMICRVGSIDLSTSGSCCCCAILSAQERLPFVSGALLNTDAQPALL